MRLLLDSHALIWAVDDPSQIGPVALPELRNSANDIFVSAATIWELSIKCALGKLTLSMPYRTWMETVLADLGAELLPISIEHADAQASLPFIHRDPFDRLLVAQAKVEKLHLVSNESIFDQYGIDRLW